MRAIVLMIAVGLLTPGCRSVRAPEEPIAPPYPPPAAPLGEFFSSAPEGIYSLPKSAVSQQDLYNYNVIVVSRGEIHLSWSDIDGQVSTNSQNFVEFKASLPSEEAFQRLTAGTTEEQIERQLGKPTGEQSRYVHWTELPSNLKIVEYSWFTVSPSSELVFMRVTAFYERGKDGIWLLRRVRWVKYGERKWSSNHTHPAGGSLPFSAVWIRDSAAAGSRR